MALRNRLDRIEPAPVLADESRKHAIIDTIYELELDPKLITLVGSAALHLYNIPLPPSRDPLDPSAILERPGDVDIASPAMYWEELRSNGATPSGIPVKFNEAISHRNRAVSNTILNVYHTNTDLLPVDIITRFNGYDYSDAIHHDKKFLDKHDKFDHIIPGTNIRIASLGRIAAELSRRGDDDKAEYDLASIVRHTSTSARTGRRQ